MQLLLRGLGLAALFGLRCVAAGEWNGSTDWYQARSPHFEVYSQTDLKSASEALEWFEELRDFFASSAQLQPKAEAGAQDAIRIIGFASAREYAAFRLRPGADAYYVGTQDQDYIVMPSLGRAQFAMAAHEYAHLVVHHAGWKLPRWLNEGLAEYYSTARKGPAGWELGGPNPMRLATLRQGRRMPLETLFGPATQASLHDETRADSALFYAQSWAVTDLLIASPAYAPRFHAFVQELSGGATTIRALKEVFGKDPQMVQRDCENRVRRGEFDVVRQPASAKLESEIQTARLSPYEGEALAAELLLANGSLDGAERLYRDLQQRSPDDADVLAALGTIALSRGERTKALQYWSDALDKGLRDARLCYRFAVLADQDGISDERVRRALEEAVLRKPDFDDARYKLALLDSNAGQFAEALTQLQAMKGVGAARAFEYWCAQAYVLTELGRRDEAVQAAQEARRHAADDAERARATQLAYLAQTDLTVQFVPDAEGNPRLMTARKQHGAAGWNPFIQPGDRIRRVTGSLKEVQCGDGKLTGFSLQTGDGVLKLTVPDPLHVQMQNSPAEFTCGAQKPAEVQVEYAEGTGTDAAAGQAGILRGMKFLHAE